MEYLPSVLSREESDGLVARIEAHFERQGFGLWAVEVPGVAEFAGFLGLGAPSFDAHFTPCVELGWRLDEQYWGFGFATEGARGAVKFAFDALHLQELVAFTVPENVSSRHVMEKLEMTHAPADDFDHPRLPEGHRLRRHVLYRLSGASSSTRS